MICRPLTFWCEWTHSSGTEILFLLGEEFGSLGVIWEKEPDKNTDNDGWDTFEDEAIMSASDLMRGPVG